MNKGFICLLSLLLIGCTKEEIVRFAPQSQAWMTEYRIGNNFIMTDSNGISQSFTMDLDSRYYLESFSHILFIATHKTSHEYRYQSFTSNYGGKFSLSLTAGYQPHGDELYVELEGVGFAYDLLHHTLSRSSRPEKAAATRMETLTVNGVPYENVLHFSLANLPEKTDPYTITEIYIVPKLGLIKYVMFNGLYYERN